jgi:hypothetical protein
MIVDSAAAIHFLRTAFESEDWIAIFLKSYETGRTAQRVGPLTLFLEPRIHAWLRAMNAQKFNCYVSVNAITPGVRARTKDAISGIRHLFLEADEDGWAVLNRVRRRRGVPEPSYVLESSPNRVHIFWRVRDFTSAAIERLQKHLAAEFHTDTAATACSQTTRLPGYRNHKRAPSHLVIVEYAASDVRRTPSDFPMPSVPAAPAFDPRSGLRTDADIVERARAYLARIEPAIAGQHGDVHTFKVCCRVVRGFALDNDEALEVLRGWNARCEPPWSERELRDKIARARKYGREPLGGLR